MAAVESPTTTATTEAPTWHMLPQEGVAQALDVEPERGLTSEEAASRLARYGPNRFAEAKTESRWHAFVRHDVRDHEPRLLVHDARRPALGVQPGYVQRPHVRARVAGIGHVDHRGHGARVPPPDPRHRGADRQPVADLHRSGAAHRGGLRDPQVPVAPPRRGRGGAIAAATRSRGAADALALSRLDDDLR